MAKPLLSRKSFLSGCAAGVTALLVGCSADDDDTGASTGSSSGGPTTDGTTASTTETATATDSTTASTTASTTNGDSSSGDSGVTEGSSGTTAESGSSSSGGSESGSASMCTEAVIIADISNNHGHALEVPLADIEAGVEVVYDASGESGHCHQVILTSEDFAALRAGMPVIKYSCNGGDHQFVLSCVAGAPAAQDPGADCDPDPLFGTCA